METRAEEVLAFVAATIAQRLSIAGAESRLS
jgi:dodecin